MEILRRVKFAEYREAWHPSPTPEDLEGLQRGGRHPLLICRGIAMKGVYFKS